jgi:chemotaxis protein MotB
MADKKAPIIIIKKKGNGHGHGHHGGAWKVAFADFMTAMMAFFLVMWLMGADEETKAAIEHYFNNPTTPWQAGRDPDSDMARPLGEQVAMGESIMNGLDGKTPDALVESPLKPHQRQLAENEDLSETAQKLLEGEIYGVDATVEFLRFSIPAHRLFMPGSLEFSPEARDTITKLGKFIRDYKGHVTVEAHTDDDRASIGRYANPFEFTMARSVAVMQQLVAKQYITEDRIRPISSGGGRALASNEDSSGRRKNRRIEFTLSTTRRY